MNEKGIEELLLRSTSTTRTGICSVRVKRIANVLDVTFFPEKDVGQVITTCPGCSKPATVADLPADPLLEWLRGEGHIQDLMPSVSADDRETLMSGMHGECFDEMFSEDEEEVDPDDDNPDSFFDPTTDDGWTFKGEGVEKPGGYGS